MPICYNTNRFYKHCSRFFELGFNKNQITQFNETDFFMIGCFILFIISDCRRTISNEFS